MSDTDDPFGEVEELFDQLTQFSSGVSSEIKVDVIDADDQLVVTADVPGRDPEHIDVRLEDDRQLHIDAEEIDEEIEGQYLSRERTHGAVSRTVRLPAAADPEETEAGYDRGVLMVRLTKLTGDEDGTDIPVN